MKNTATKLKDFFASRRCTAYNKTDQERCADYELNEFEPTWVCKHVSPMTDRCVCKNSQRPEFAGELREE